MKSDSEDRSQAEATNLRGQYGELLDTVGLCEQLDELLDTVVRCERRARVQRVQDLIDAHLRFEQLWRKGFERPQHGEGETSQQ